MVLSVHGLYFPCNKDHSRNEKTSTISFFCVTLFITLSIRRYRVTIFYEKHLRINTLYSFSTIPKTHNIKKKLNSILPIELPHRGESLHPTKLDIGGKIFLSFGGIVTSDSPSVLLHRQSSLTDDLSEFVPAWRHLFIPTLIWEYQRAKDFIARCLYMLYDVG